ncbi:MAG: hypothetical protein IJR00_07410, partial [Lachnospiraceae bacterium]|nr:hypothetical protein [Lachnospiraceae bacterium]
TEYSYEDGFNHNIPYENGTIRINDISFTEKKAGAYYEAHAEVIIGLSELSNDEYQWFMDEYRDQSDHSVLTGEIETVFYVMVDDELERMNLVSMEKNTGKNKELILQYQFDEYKRSIDGNDAIFQFDFEKPESFRFEDKDGKVSFLNKSDKYIFNFTVSLMD